MKNELNYYTIGDSFGGNQDWFTTFPMRLGGCAAATACDASIVLARNYNILNIYPYKKESIEKQDYIEFSNEMKSYLKPRLQGINRIELFQEGYKEYLKEHSIENISVSGFKADQSLELAQEFIIKQIDQGMPIPYLLLRHRNVLFKHMTWHWFLVIGYEEEDGRFYIQVATYGKKQKFELKTFWDTGFSQKGGMVQILINK